MTPLLATSIVLSLGLVVLSINCIMLSRQISHLTRRVLDLEYPLSAETRRRAASRQ